jgi:hypothetical protein
MGVKRVYVSQHQVKNKNRKILEKVQGQFCHMVRGREYVGMGLGRVKKQGIVVQTRLLPSTKN